MKTRGALPLALLASFALAAPAWADKTPACVRWSQETVHAGIGYNHVVSIENTCDRPVTCTVSTDVAPEPIRVSVPGKQRVDLTTFRGSPASTFRAKVACSFD